MLTRRTPRACALLALSTTLLAPGVLRAEDELQMAYGDAQTISLASGRAQPLRRAPAVASVITAADIAAAGATDLDEALALVPGLHVSYSPIGYAPGYGIRGLLSLPTNPQVLVLQNGLPMTSVYTGDRGNSWSGYPLENVARIEVIRGPGSALHGAEAFAGVINIITKSPAELQPGEAGLRLGSFRSRAAWLQRGLRWGELTLGASLNLSRTEGQRRTLQADAASRLDTLFGTRASLAPGPVNTGRAALDASFEAALRAWRLQLSYRARDDVGTGAGVNSALDPGSVIDTRRWMADLSWNAPQLAPDWAAASTLAFHHYHERAPRGLQLFPPGTRIGPSLFPDGMIGGPWRWERAWRWSAQADYGGWAGHRLRLGLGFEDVHLYRAQTFKNFLISPGGLPLPTGPVIDYGAIQPHISPARRRNHYALLQDEWQLAPDWTLTAGLRHDRYSDVGPSTNPRLALVWAAAHDLSLKLLHGHAFRAPNFNELYSVNPVTSGNPQLHPERIRTSELAAIWEPSTRLRLGLNLFSQRAREVIRAVPNPPPLPGSLYQNIGRLNGRGGELEFSWEAAPGWRLQGFLSRQQTLDLASASEAGYAPRRQAYLRLDWQLAARQQLGLQARHAGDRRRAAGDPRPAVRDLNSLDLLWRWAASPDWELAATLRNALDADLREPTLPGGTLPHDLPLAGRALGVQAVLRW